MSEIDLSTWLTKQHAADRAGVSTKAIERWTQARKIPAIKDRGWKIRRTDLEGL